MSYKASSTKERFDELQKNPLFFCKYGTVKVQDEMGYSHSKEGWSSCDPTIDFFLYEDDLPQINQQRRLFIIGDQIFTNGEVDNNKEKQDSVDFDVIEFDYCKVSDWIHIINDCLYNYRSGNIRHCHMTLSWALYTTEWKKEVLSHALSEVSPEAFQTACNYICTNIFVFSLNKQHILVELFQHKNPNLQALVIPDVEVALNEIAPSKDFSTYGFYGKVDFILNYGSSPEEQAHLQKLYRRSLNSFIHFKYWMEHQGNTFYNYNYLESIFSYVNPLQQLSIVKRYLHDVRLNLIEVDFTLLEYLRDVRYQAFVDNRYFITTPGDNIDLVAPMFCDALLTLKKSDGKKIQDFNGILDFAIRHSNTAYPKIDLGTKYFVPTCDGGLMYNSYFFGFIHYSIQYTFDESKLTEENLQRTIGYLLRNYTTLQYHYCCKADNNKELTTEELKKCQNVIRTVSYKTENNQSVRQVKRSACSYAQFEPIEPKIWKKNPGNDNILNLIVENIASKKYIKVEDIKKERLKTYLLSLGNKHHTFSFINDNPPEYLRKDDVAYNIVSSYYTPSTMVIYPNKSMFYSSKRSLLGAWNEENDPLRNSEKEAQRAESPIVFEHTFASLKEMFPDAEFGDDYIKLHYNGATLSNIQAYYHFRNHVYDPVKGYEESSMLNLKFLAPRPVNGVFYCTPKAANSREKVSDLPFFWCRSDECFCNMLNDQTLEKQDDWRKYTLYHAAEIIGVHLIKETEKGNIPVEAVSNFAGEVRQAEKLYARLKCRSCGHMIFSTRGSILNGSRFFACSNSLCPQYRIEIYLSQCNSCKRGLIDSRDSKKCENGWVICPSCLACCNDDLFNKLITMHRRNGYIPIRLRESEGKGHNNKGIFFCPQCGMRLGTISVEESVRLADGTNSIVNHTVFGCPQCKKPYNKELEKYQKSQE